MQETYSRINLTAEGICFSRTANNYGGWAFGWLQPIDITGHSALTVTFLDNNGSVRARVGLSPDQLSPTSAISGISFSTYADAVGAGTYTINLADVSDINYLVIASLGTAHNYSGCLTNISLT